MIKTTKKTKAKLKPTTAEGRICLELMDPAAKSVAVAGSFNEWSPETSPMSVNGEGKWTKELAVGPGRYEYLFVVDGAWLPDPQAKETVQNPFGGRNSVLVVAK